MLGIGLHGHGLIQLAVIEFSPGYDDVNDSAAFVDSAAGQRGGQIAHVRGAGPIRVFGCWMVSAGCATRDGLRSPLRIMPRTVAANNLL